jgi:3-deoxy-manno-octulosonate cytidylyltransferase (CMP-KDO synthetase)
MGIMQQRAGNPLFPFIGGEGAKFRFLGNSAARAINPIHRIHLRQDSTPLPPVPSSPPKSPPARPRVVAVIPARLTSARLPNKVLLPIAGTPMLGWVYRAAIACKGLEQVLIATDSSEVVAYADSQGWPSIMTSATLPSGTDRVHAVSTLIDADIYVNIQGDEPLLRPEHIDALLRPFARTAAEVTTLSTPCAPEEIHNPNAVKVVTASDGRALYFSRATIPHHRDGATECQKHLGLYAYRKPALQRFAALPPSPLERAERLEQLRLLENGISVYVEQTAFDTIGVDTEEDRAAVERILRQQGF